jgi:leucyl-tRNA synthetase
MFIGPWSDGGPYRPEGIEGITRWLNRVWSLVLEPASFGGVDEEATRELERQRHRTVRVVTDDLENFRFNTMLARLMEYTSFLARAKEAGNVAQGAWQDAIGALMLMIAPSAPHIAEELWARTGHPYSVHQQSWPQYDEALAAAETFTLVVQVNGRLRDRIDVPVGISEAEAKELAQASDKVRPYTEGQQVARVVYVPGRLVNIVLR